MHNFCAKYGKNRDIYKQMAKVFWASLSLRRLRDCKSTRLRVADAGASLSLRRLLVYKTTRLQVADALGFAVASQTTSLQVHKTTSGCRLGLRWRYADEVALSYEQ